MVVPTLISEKYVKVNPHVIALPTPYLNGPVGLRCPVCMVPMEYKKAKVDSWLIGCPTPQNEHNWKTWRCDQLNHELAMINLGTPRPIVSKPGDWGPRVSTQGEILDDVTAAANCSTGRHHPYPRPVQKPHVVCKRVNEGSLSQNHKDAGNKGCPSQYCRGCCTEFGSALCTKHPRKSVIPPQQLELFGHQAQPIAKAATANSQSAAQSRASAASSTPHQWAQSSNSIGRLVSSQSMALIHQNRIEREKSAHQHSNRFDLSKMATIYLWLNAVEPKAYTAVFPQWPQACFDQCELLMQAVMEAVPQWNRALSFWDEKNGGWCDTLVQYPHRFRANQRKIVARLQTVVIPRTATHHSVAAIFAKTPPTSAFLSTSDLPAICETPSSPTTPLISQKSIPAQQTDCSLSVANATGFQMDTQGKDFPSSSSQTSPSPSPTPATPHIDLTQSPNDSAELPSPSDLLSGPVQPSVGDIETREDEIETNSSTTELQGGWPGTTVLVSTLLAWYKDALTGRPKQKWIAHFGGEWKFTSSMYRYRKWIKEVDYEVMFNRFQSQPEATVDEARDVYIDVFNKVASLQGGSSKS
ncbi:uncharacterized protein MELLADRAFT_107847 [Melampsora larici-populina 98AG31]|uniref:Uncharacterized protein n=1 Tax=Melampsora larici-populina (strain 98AG31 / pathotype 3-4-7) TaxID=747676 RepID=F4RR45_MELLP|nr:uncharacterized protein MELLADRAFT_107847 [Melampsora larici-populina 98AG31]EGG05151.1 hypothetical protein MELLADRAFT_107847 [Melampsora larici-populina 98AG31]